jgi:very-short-patch-repair endonuclease
MGAQSLQNSVSAAAWQLARRQHGVITRGQLIGLGIGAKAIKHRLAKGRLHPVSRGVYAVGRPQVTRNGRWMAAVLACGKGALLSHVSAASLWGIRSPAALLPVHVSVGTGVSRSRRGIRLHRRASLTDADRTRRDGIPVTTPGRTLIDLATLLKPNRLEEAVNEADKLGLIDPEMVRRLLDERARVDGVPALRSVLDRRTFQLTDSELERRFLRLVRRAGLPPPRTRERVNGYRVDFHWPELGLVVETDGLRYHRTPGQQAKDRVRDQAHTAAGLTPLRFTHAQVAFEPGRVVELLRSVAERRRLEVLTRAA